MPLSSFWVPEVLLSWEFKTSWQPLLPPDKRKHSSAAQGGWVQQDCSQPLQACLCPSLGFVTIGVEKNSRMFSATPPMLRLLCNLLCSLSSPLVSFLKKIPLFPPLRQSDGLQVRLTWNLLSSSCLVPPVFPSPLPFFVRSFSLGSCHGACGHVAQLGPSWMILCMHAIWQGGPGHASSAFPCPKANYRQQCWPDTMRPRSIAKQLHEQLISSAGEEVRMAESTDWIVLCV